MDTKTVRKRALSASRGCGVSGGVYKNVIPLLLHPPAALLTSLINTFN